MFFGTDAQLTHEHHKESDIEVVLNTEEELRQSVIQNEFLALSSITFYSVCKIKGFF